MKLQRQWIIKGININQGTEFVEGVFYDEFVMLMFIDSLDSEQSRYFEFWVETRDIIVPSDK